MAHYGVVRMLKKLAVKICRESGMNSIEDALARMS